MKNNKLRNLGNEECEYWMVIGRSELEGEYPVKFNLTEKEAKELASKRDGDVARKQPLKL